MSADDILFAPILPPAVLRKIKELIRRVLTTAKSETLTNHVSREIADLLHQHGITDEQEIADVVDRAIRECQIA